MKTIIYIIAAVLIVSSIVFAQDIQDTINNKNVLSKVQQCIDVPFNEYENTYGTCITTKKVSVCSDFPTNKSCGYVDKQTTYGCLNEGQAKKCMTVGYVIGDVKLNTENYICSSSVDEGRIKIICDSIYDGNGDGICTSGESCFEFEIENGNVVRRERNSGNKFVESEESFFMKQRVSAEKI